MSERGQLPISTTGEFLPVFMRNSHADRARGCLRDLMRFYFALQNEMALVSAAGDTDTRLMDMMKNVNRRYLRVMKGFEGSSDERQRHALVSLADAIRDMMFYIYSKRAGHYAG